MRALRSLVAVLLGSVLLSGCDFDVYSLPLPGGTDTGEDPITVTVHFRDVLDLVPRSDVKVNDVSVGQVTEVSLDGQTAVVELELRADTDLPDNAVASIRQTSLLGEKFVSLAAPESPSPEPLEDRDVIPLERSGRNPEVEEVLGALSLVLNGGGVAQLKTITTELNQALVGREESARSVLHQIEDLTAVLDQNKGDIVHALEALNRLSVTVRGQQDIIDKTLEELPSALRSIDAQRADLVRMLDALDRLGEVGVRVIDASKDSTVETLRLLRPILNDLADSGDDLANALHAFYAYPFVDEVVGRDPQVARNLHMGDYVNLSVRLDLDLTQLVPELPDLPTEQVCITLDQLPEGIPLSDLPANLCEGATEALDECLDDLQDLSLDTRACQQLPQHLIDTILEEVGTVTDALCTDLPGLSGILGTLPVCPSDGSGGGSEGPSLPDLPSLPPLLGGGTDDPDGDSSDGGLLGGLLRNEPGWTDPRPMTVGQLHRLYDPALVDLMLPGMVTAP